MRLLSHIMGASIYLVDRTNLLVMRCPKAAPLSVLLRDSAGDGSNKSNMLINNLV